MILKVERGGQTGTVAEGALIGAIASGIKHNLMVSCSVENFPYGTLPRSERKTRRVFDNRAY